VTSSDMTSSAVGRLLRTTVKLTVPPDSLVESPLVGLTVMLAGTAKSSFRIVESPLVAPARLIPRDWPGRR
jgi:hypothetical protein